VLVLVVVVVLAINGVGVGVGVGVGTRATLYRSAGPAPCFSSIWQVLLYGHLLASVGTWNGTTACTAATAREHDSF
jgi:hypothetical protein